MKSVGVVTDSHSSMKPQEAEALGVMLLPMPFYLDEVCYYEDVTITRDEFFEKVRGGAKVSTSQPTPDAVCKLWDQALEKFDEIVYIPLSSALSGACSTAMMLAKDEPYEGIGRGNINIENIPVYCDEVGPFGTPTSDTPRTRITEETKTILLFITSFNGTDGLLQDVELAKDLFSRFGQMTNFSLEIVE